MNLNFHKLHNLAQIKHGSSQARGLDLITTQTLTLPFGKTLLAPTGIATEPEPGISLDLNLRFSLGLKNIVLANSTGIIDNDYRGEIKAELLYLGTSLHPDLKEALIWIIIEIFKKNRDLEFSSLEFILSNSSESVYYQLHKQALIELDVIRSLATSFHWGDTLQIRFPMLDLTVNDLLNICTRLILFNQGTWQIYQGERIAQLSLVKDLLPTTLTETKLNSTTRGSKGFGSTGI